MHPPLFNRQKNWRQKDPLAFTLIELLVVIAIITILMGLIFPAATSAIYSARKTTAKNQAVQIATALTAYETEYGQLPTNSGSNVGVALVNILTANDTNNNPRALNFLDTSAWKLGKGGTNSSGYCDPFGSNNVYSVSLDTNYSNILTNMPYQASPGGTISTTNITKHIGVWTVSTNRSQTNLIDSWE